MEKLDNKISNILEEIRIVTPGTQALLGFQFSSVFSTAFEKLAPSLKVSHLFGLMSVLLCTLFFMSVPAYHRVAEKGVPTESFYMYANKMLLIAMAALGMGLSIDVYVVSAIITKSSNLSVGIACLIGVLFYCMWFGFTFFKREEK